MLRLLQLVGQPLTSTRPISTASTPHAGHVAAATKPLPLRRTASATAKTTDTAKPAPVLTSVPPSFKAASVSRALAPVVASALASRAPAVPLTALSTRNISTALRNTPTPLAASIQLLKTEAESNVEDESAKQKRLLSVVGSLKNAKHRADFFETQVTYVPHCQYGITDATDKYPVLATRNANGTFALMLYDSKNKIAALAHIVPINELSCLLPIIDKMSREHTVAHLVGGGATELKRIIEILAFLEEQSITVINADVGRLEKGGPNSTGIDARTGDIYSNITHDDIGYYFEYPWSLEPSGFPLVLMYDGMLPVKNDTVEQDIDQNTSAGMRR